MGFVEVACTVGGVVVLVLSKVVGVDVAVDVAF